LWELCGGEDAGEGEEEGRVCAEEDGLREALAVEFFDYVVDCEVGAEEEAARGLAAPAACGDGDDGFVVWVDVGEVLLEGGDVCGALEVALLVAEGVEVVDVLGVTELC
jgi:hypothetical protein